MLRSASILALLTGLIASCAASEHRNESSAPRPDSSNKAAPQVAPPLPERPTSAASWGPERVSRAYEVTLGTDLDLEIRDPAVDVKRVRYKSVSKVAYRISAGATPSVYLEHTRVHLQRDGVTVLDVSVNRDRIRTVENGQVEEFNYRDAPPAGKKIMEHQYRRPVYSVELDAFGREIKRTLSPNVTESKIQDTLASTRLFHAPFRTDRAEWTAPVLLSINRQAARGTLTFRRREPEADGLVPVGVSGVLKRDAPETRIRYEVTGIQRYDPKIGDYRTGEWAMKAKGQVRKGDVTVEVAGMVKAQLAPFVAE